MQSSLEYLSKAHSCGIQVFKGSFKVHTINPLLVCTICENGVCMRAFLFFSDLSLLNANH
eukprot:c22546_g1_i1 orf=119-298(+)